MLPKYHVKLGHDVTVIASLLSFDDEGKVTYLSGPSVRNDEGGFKVVRIAYKRPHKINRFLRRYEGLFELLERESPDIIFCHGLSMVEINTLVRYKKKHPSTAFYADQHGDYINSATNVLSKFILHPIIWRYYVKKIEPHLVKVYGVTPLRCKFLKEMYGVNPGLIEFLPMGIDDDAIPVEREKVRAAVRERLGVGSTDLLIFTGGKIDKIKNTHVLLDALQHLNRDKIHLVICGVLCPEMEYLKRSFNDRIHYLGWCNAEQVMDCMVASDIACFPGRHSTLWEQAVGLGLPAVFKNWDEEQTHVNVNGNALFVAGDDSAEIQACILKFLDPSFMSDIRSKAKSASSTFLYSNIAKAAIAI
jgi:glycosyltransferase involved in cell wall biosynthesis